MSTKLHVTAIAAATAVLVTPMLASAMTATHGKLRLPRNVHASVVLSPDYRMLGTDPDPAVRFELRRDWARGR
jgi:hypothetical protein